MRLRKFGRAKEKVSVIGMGTYYDPLWIAAAYLGWKRGGADKVEAVKAGLDAGVTLVDTAEIYQSEPLVARAIAGRKRDEVFVATKVWSNHLRRDAVERSFRRSLARLGTSYIDLYQVHFPNQKVPVRETMEAMESLVSEGKLRYVGVSNFDLTQIKEAQSALPKSELCSVQLDYSLANRRVEEEILPYCQKEGIALLAYYPLGHGKLVSGPRLAPAASSSGRSRAQIALSWLAGQEGVFPIPRASRVSHVTENAAAGDWEIPAELRVDIDSKFR